MELRSVIPVVLMIATNAHLDTLTYTINASADAGNTPAHVVNKQVTEQLVKIPHQTAEQNVLNANTNALKKEDMNVQLARQIFTIFA